MILARIRAYPGNVRRRYRYQSDAQALGLKVIELFHKTPTASVVMVKKLSDSDGVLRIDIQAGELRGEDR